MRKSKTVRTIAFALSIMLILSGCRIGNIEITFTGFGEKVTKEDVFALGDMKCGIKEAKVYLSNYQNIYKTAYGIDLWQQDFGDDSLVQYIKSITLGSLTKVYGMMLLAKENKIKLSDEELSKIKEAAEVYYESLSTEELAYMEVSLKDIEEFYSHYALAEKLYRSMAAEVNKEVSDDEARVMEIMQIFVSTEEKAQTVLKKLNNGEDFATVAGIYNELPGSYANVSRDDLPKEVATVAFEMDNGEVSDKLAVENGFYIIRCMNKFNQELTEANKVNILLKRQKEAVDDIYDDFMEALNSNIDEEVWESLTPDTSGSIVTDSFFDVFATYCGDL